MSHLDGSRHGRGASNGNPGCGCGWIFLVVILAMVHFFNHRDGPVSTSVPPVTSLPFQMTWSPGANVDFPDPWGNPPLHQAILTDNLDAFCQIWSEGASLRAVDGQERTILLAALESRQNDFVERILDDNDLVTSLANRASKRFRTPLMAAMEWGSASISFKLIDHGADIHWKTPFGRTMMHSAAIGGDPDLVAYLIEQGLDVNARHDGNFTPLHYAAQEGHPEAVLHLLANGADRQARVAQGWTAADLARGRGRVEIARHLSDPHSKIFPTFSHDAEFDPQAFKRALKECRERISAEKMPVELERTDTRQPEEVRWPKRP